MGNSWSKTFSGLISYSQASSIDALDRPIFEIRINDSEVLCEVSSPEDELILKKKFKHNNFRAFNQGEKAEIFT